MAPSWSHRVFSPLLHRSLTRSVRLRPLACRSGVLLALLTVMGCGSGDGQVDENLTQPAALVLTGFNETLVANGIANPTAMEFAPDGRLFVCAQGGELRVIKNGALLPTPFLDLPVDSDGERGLLGVTVHPNFASNNFVYVYYTATTPAPHNRLSRFTANGDVAVPGSEVVLLELENLSAATNHNGGVIHFLPDGRLYVAVGENADAANAQSIGNRLGKILRINSDGSIPADNPSSFPGISGTTSGVNRAIWAVGLRNPFTFAVQPGTGRMFINDVGAAAWEEINDGIAGRNYGWPNCEGDCNNSNYTDPLFAYSHSGGVCAITGGAFYNPTTQQFPAQYVGKYFFADFCAGWIRYLDLSTNAVTDFASGIANPVDLKVHPDGSLYYLAYGAGAVFKIQFTGSQAPSITTHPSNQTATVGQSATFVVSATGAAPLGYRWQKNGANISGATAASYTTPPTVAGDNGATYRCVISNSFGSVTSNAATLTVTGNVAPTATITSPANNALYTAGDVVNYSGTGNDVPDGTLPPSAFTWQVDFGHDTHFHPVVPATSGSRTGSFTIPTSGETSANVFYRIILTVRDSGGLTHTTYVDIRPRTSTITLASNPSGLRLTLDGQPVTTPFSVLGVQGVTRQLAAPSPQTAAGRNWTFSAWSDGGAAAHNIATPAVSTTYTATFQDAGPATAAFDQDSGPDGLVSIEAEHFDAQSTQGGHSWTPAMPSGASGSALAALPDNGALVDVGYTTGSPGLDYRVKFVKTGTHYIWVRGVGPAGTGLDDSCHAGLDGQAIGTADRIGSYYGIGLNWLNSTMDGPPASIDVATAGVHTVNLWMREDGFVADKLLITSNPNFSPTGSGPAESSRSGASNVPPTVGISSPAGNTTFSAPATVTILADAGDSDGGVTKVEFFQGSTKLGEDTTSPYSFTWNGVPTGSYSLTAQATDSSGAVTVSSPVSIAVNPGAFQQDAGADGLVSIEAEHFDAQAAQGGHSWTPASPPGASGTAQAATPDNGALVDAGYTTGSPRLDYQVNFVKSGVHYLWVRGVGPVGGGADDSCHAGLDGQAIDTSDRIGSYGTSLAWLNQTMDGPVATITVATTGVHTLNLWMREDGFVADKLLITTNANYSPSGNGPLESGRAGGGPTPTVVPPAPTATRTSTLPAAPSPTATRTPALPSPTATRTPALPSATATRTPALPSPSATPSQTPALPSPTPLGLTTVGTFLDSDDSNYLNGSRVFASAGGQIVSMSVFVATVDPASANRRFQLAIYTDTAGLPGSLIATTAAGTLVANAWNTASISAALQPNTSYWLIYNTNGQSIDVNNMRYNSSPGQGVYSASVPFGTWPSTFPASVMTDVVYSLYATFGP